MDGAPVPSSSRPRPSSRPTTPLRPSSRSSLREAHGYGHSISASGYNQPAINALEPQFAELADSMADLEANFMHLQLMHESLTRFSESFASFLYGLNMNAFCVDFPEVRSDQRYRRDSWEDAPNSFLTYINFCLGTDLRFIQKSKEGRGRKRYGCLVYTIIITPPGSTANLEAQKPKKSKMHVQLMTVK